MGFQSLRVRQQVTSVTMDGDFAYFQVGCGTRLLVFLAVTGGLTAAIVLSLSGELVAHLIG